MTVLEHVTSVERAYVARIWRPRAEREANAILRKLDARRIIEMLVAIPSKRQYRRLLGPTDQAASTDRRVSRKMRRDVNVREAVRRVRRWGGVVTDAARERQPREYADAMLVRAAAYQAATRVRVRARVTRAELAQAGGILILGKTLRELVRASAGRLAGRLADVPLAAASWASRRKTAMEPAIRVAARAALDRFAFEVRVLVIDYWYAAIQHAWSRPFAVKAKERR